MKNIGIRVYATEQINGVLGIASVTLAGQLAVTGIKIREGQYGKFLCMPSRVIEEGPGNHREYADLFYPVNKDVRKELTEMVLAVYEEAVATPEKVFTKDVPASALPLSIGITPKNIGNEKADVILKIGGEYYLEGIAVRYKPDEDRYFVTMPSYKTKDGDFKNYAYPVSKEYREELNGSIMEAFEKTLQESAPGQTL